MAGSKRAGNIGKSVKMGFVSKNEEKIVRKTVDLFFEFWFHLSIKQNSTIKILFFLFESLGSV